MGRVGKVWLLKGNTKEFFGVLGFCILFVTVETKIFACVITDKTVHQHSEYCWIVNKSKLSVNKLSLLLSHVNKTNNNTCNSYLLSFPKALKPSISSCFIFQLNDAFDSYVAHLKDLGTSLRTGKISSQAMSG